MTELTLQQANGLIQAVFESALQKDMPALAVAVLDSGAHLKALQRQDGVSFLRVRIAQAKAWGALGMASNTDLIAQRYDQDELQRGFIDALNAMTGGQVIPLPGGILVRNTAGEIIGAIGAAGGVSEDDALCVVEGIKSMGFQV